ncbi:MAG: DNA polymerase III subunit beta [Candidatus Brennerbacteria bacterium]|nr:DNA polymerase III subunit beta [Candidatus Brennerbacteria bacterium]
MKIIVLKENLKNGLSSVERSINDQSTLPILKNILIKTENNKTFILGTNLELAVTHSMAGKIFENGSVSVPFKVFTGLINNLPTERINLEKNNHNLIIKTDNYEAVIQGINFEDFPIIPRINISQYSFKIKSDIFKDAVLKVINAAQFSDLRPEISGILMDYQIENLKLAATDSFRLAEKIIPENQFSSNLKQSVRLVIPLKTAGEILKTVKDNIDLEIFFDNNQILFKTDDLEIISRLIEGEYPDYRQIIPKSFATELSVNKDDFLNALKLASVFSGRNNDVKLKVLENKKTLEVYSANEGLGENRYLVPVKANGTPINISFNLKYLIDGLKNHNSEQIILGLNNSDKPSMIKSEKNPLFFYILMPIRN